MSILVGITGQTGAGKTTACSFFVDRGFGIIDCDKVAREVTALGSKCLVELTKEFSESILNPDKTLNRKYLGEIVFADKQKLERLNKILHPAIIQRVSELAADMEKDFPIILIDAPTLFESGADAMCDKIIAITTSEKKSISRIIRRDNIDVDIASKRLASQYDRAFFEAHSDFVAQNNGSISSFKKTLTEIADKLEQINTMSKK